MYPSLQRRQRKDEPAADYAALIPQRILCRKYISLEAKIAKDKDLYYDALSRSQDGWHEGTEDVIPFIKYILSTILAAYKDFGDRFSIVEEKLPAIDMVKKRQSIRSEDLRSRISGNCARL